MILFRDRAATSDKQTIEWLEHIGANLPDGDRDEIIATNPLLTIGHPDPVLPSQLQFVSSGGVANLTSAQQNDIGRGSIVTTTDGFREVYSGSGLKTLAASCTVLGDMTPAWDSVTDKPSYFTSNIVNVAGLQAALNDKLTLSHTIHQNLSGSLSATNRLNINGPSTSVLNVEHEAS